MLSSTNDSHSSIQDFTTFLTRTNPAALICPLHITFSRLPACVGNPSKLGIKILLRAHKITCCITPVLLEKTCIHPRNILLNFRCSIRGQRQSHINHAQQNSNSPPHTITNPHIYHGLSSSGCCVRSNPNLFRQFHSPLSWLTTVFST